VKVHQQVTGEQRTEMVRTVRVYGGTIGCHTFSYGGHESVTEPGQRYVFFLGFATPETGLVDVQLVDQMWSIDENYDVSTPLDGDIPLSALVDRINAAARDSAD